MRKEKKIFTISAVSKALDIPKHIIRCRQKACPELLSIQRTQGGQRRFNRKDIVRIGEIKAMRDQGMSLVEIRSLFTPGDPMNGIGSIQTDLLAQRVVERIKVEVSDFLRAETGQVRKKFPLCNSPAFPDEETVIGE